MRGACARQLADLVVELGRSPPAGGLRDQLARAFGDPSLELLHARDDGAGWVDGDGRPVALPRRPGPRGDARARGRPRAVRDRAPARPARGSRRRGRARGRRPPRARARAAGRDPARASGEPARFARADRRRGGRRAPLARARSARRRAAAPGHAGDRDPAGAAAAGGARIRASMPSSAPPRRTCARRSRSCASWPTG